MSDIIFVGDNRDSDTSFFLNVLRSCDVPAKDLMTTALPPPNNYVAIVRVEKGLPLVIRDSWPAGFKPPVWFADAVNIVLFTSQVFSQYTAADIDRLKQTFTRTAAAG